MSQKELTKTSFIDFISEHQGISKADANRSLSYILDGLEEALKLGNKVTFTGFGSFYISKIEARKGRNPKTGEIMELKASKSVKFKSGSKLKGTINK